MKVYINGLGNVSPQHTTENDHFLEEVINQNTKALWNIKPDYKSLIKGVNLRRMSRILKDGLFSAQICLNDSQQTDLDAIITGTGLGCQEDTEKFLTNIYGNHEGVVSPTQFIQSTHNALSAQIAMMLQCKKYNFTYTHRGASFESALLDAMMLIAENAENVLVGGLDEVTDNYLKITNRIKLWKRHEFDQLDLFDQKGPGSLPGEGAQFFMLSNKKNKKTYAKILGLKLLFKPDDNSFLQAEIDSLLDENGLKKSDIDFILTGKNGNEDIDSKIDEVFDASGYEDIAKGGWKHLCGEYKTSVAFGLWTASQMLAKQRVPDVVMISGNRPKKIRNLLLYNNYNNINHSAILMQHVES